MGGANRGDSTQGNRPQDHTRDKGPASRRNSVKARQEIKTKKKKITIEFHHQDQFDMAQTRMYVIEFTHVNAAMCANSFVFCKTLLVCLEV